MSLLIDCVRVWTWATSAYVSQCTVIRTPRYLYALLAANGVSRLSPMWRESTLTSTAQEGHILRGLCDQYLVVYERSMAAALPACMLIPHSCVIEESETYVHEEG
eukprot:3938332-Rhodomonas_salina.2